MTRVRPDISSPIIMLARARRAGVCKEYGVDNVGTVPATLTTYLAIQTFAPDLVISAGTAGAFKAKGAAIGDVYHSTHTINHDRLIEIPAFTAYGMDLRPATPCPNMVEALGLKVL
jgi:5'-methylthioadenosine nucleosidase